MDRRWSVAALLVAAGCGARKEATETDAPMTNGDAALAIDAGVDAAAGVDFTETYGASTADVGDWILTTNPMRPRTIEPTGGNPDGYVYGEVASAIPTWSTASTGYQPGVNDSFKRDSVFTGDWYEKAIHGVDVDLEIQQVGSWVPGRTVTLHIAQWDAAHDTIAYDAFYSPPDIPDAPVGWQHYAFTADARATSVPDGWDFTRGDGTPGNAADWTALMHRVDLVAFGYWRPGYGYPSLGLWKLGIDNIHITATP